MKRFFSPLFIMMSVVIMVAALADRSASADFGDADGAYPFEEVTICHPITSQSTDGTDVAVYRLSPGATRIIDEHRAHGDRMLDVAATAGGKTCPGNVIHVERI